MVALATVMVGWLSAIASPVPVARFPTAAADRAESQSPPAKGPTAAVRGVVTKVSETELVIRRSSVRHPANLTLELSHSTATTGRIAVGDHVSVRYRAEGDVLIATAVTIEKHKPPD